ncbi:hypothetical protein KORDIASMS9_02532 [Kordia sp. SMS9]|nr:hypothetical protein KORDIASMS9_02532 [Kordia sp. SMS9]
MKKRSIKNLSLNKKSVASVNKMYSIKGGNTVHYCETNTSANLSCYGMCAGTNATTGCTLYTLMWAWI